MTNPNKSRIDVILDRSGSMWDIKVDVEGGFKTFIEEQKKLDGECTVSLVQFDNEYEVCYTDKPIAEVPPLILEPRGTTALYDAIAKTIVNTGRELAALPEDERPGAVTVVILTDGGENDSSEYRGIDGQARVKALVEEQQNTYSWQFIFMGSNQDAVLVGQTLGFNAGSSLTFTNNTSGIAFANAARSTTAYRGGMTKGMTYAAASAAAAFTDDERAEALDE